MNRLGRLATSSCEYKIDVDFGILTITGYYSGETIHIDLTKIPDEVLEEIELTDEDMELEECE